MQDPGGANFSGQGGSLLSGMALTTEKRETLTQKDRRRKPRIHIPFPVSIEGQDENDEPFKAQTVLDNFSSNSMYFRIFPHVVQGNNLSIVVGLSVSKPFGEAPAKISIDGVVRRADRKDGGVFGVAVTFKKARFL